MSEETPQSLLEIASNLQPIEPQIIKEIDWVAISEAMVKAFESFIAAFSASMIEIQKWYDELPDELKQRIEGKSVEDKKQRAKRDLDNKRRMARGGKWKAF